MFSSNIDNLQSIVWFQVFLSNTNNYKFSSYYFYLQIVICLNPVIWFGFLCFLCLMAYKPLGAARGVMVIVAGNGHGDTSSNPGRD